MSPFFEDMKLLENVKLALRKESLVYECTDSVIRSSQIIAAQAFATLLLGVSPFLIGEAALFNNVQAQQFVGVLVSSVMRWSPES